MATRSPDFTLRTSHFKLLLFFVALPLNCIAGDVAHATLRGACSKVNITPPLGITLIGSKGQPSDSVKDELFAKAMVLNDGVTTLAIVSADLLYTPLEDITRPVRTIINEKTGIPMQNIMVCATHTHSGPEVFTRSKIPSEGRLEASRIDQSYLQILVRKMADSVLLAHRNLEEVKIGATVGIVSEIHYNRRFIAEGGQARMAFTVPEAVAATRKVETRSDGRTRAIFTLPAGETPAEFGAIDPAVGVLRMEDPEGHVIGSLIGFGCHPVCIYPFLSTTISADYPAHATRVVEEVEGGTSLFLLGLAGNAVPLRRDVKPCEQLGKAIGGEALRRLQTIPTSGDVALTAATRELALPLKAEAGQDRITTEIQVLKIGETCILGLPGEILVEVGLAIKDKAGVDNLIIATLANDAVGYVCHRQAYKEGGYESGSRTLLAEGAAEMIIEQALDLLHQVANSDNITVENPRNP